MKQKRLVAWVLAIALVILAGGALAAQPMSAKEFVEKVLAPKPIPNTDEWGDPWWTQDEVAEIIRLGEEHGVRLPPEDLVWLAYSQGEYKDEMMYLYAEMELGPYPNAWSSEDQFWIDQLIVENCPDAFQTCFLPEAGEINEKQAAEIALGHIRSEHDPAADVTNEAIYRRYLVFTLDDEDWGSRVWQVHYEALDLVHDGYFFLITPQGEIVEERIYEGISLEGDRISTPEELESRYWDVYGTIYDWEPDTWVAFRAALKKTMLAHGSEDAAYVHILLQEYGVPDAGALTKEEAIQKAALAVVEKGLVAEGGLEVYSAFATYLLDGERAVWRAVIPGKDYLWYWAEMDAHSGEVQKTGEWERGDLWHQNVVLDAAE